MRAPALRVDPVGVPAGLDPHEISILGVLIVFVRRENSSEKFESFSRIFGLGFAIFILSRIGWVFALLQTPLGNVQLQRFPGPLAGFQGRFAAGKGMEGNERRDEMRKGGEGQELRRIGSSQCMKRRIVS